MHGDDVSIISCLPATTRASEQFLTGNYQPWDTPMQICISMHGNAFAGQKCWRGFSSGLVGVNIEALGIPSEETYANIL